MIAQLIFCSLAGFSVSLVVYFLTALILGEKQARQLPGGAFCAGGLMAIWIGSDILLPAMLVSVAAALFGHFVMAVATAPRPNQSHH